METVLVTGASGALGAHLLAALQRELPTALIGVLLRPEKTTAPQRLNSLRRRVAEFTGGNPDDDAGERLFALSGDVRQHHCGLAPATVSRLAGDVTRIVHASADTRFRGDETDQWKTNVEGTAQVLQLAAGCRRLERLVVVSTNCVAGKRSGQIEEQLSPTPPEFVNFYERTKWEAEQRTSQSGLPATIVRLATCVGSERDGSVERLGGLHWAWQWMFRGLVPMVPGRPDCSVDLISSELAAAVIARAAASRDGGRWRVCQVSSGSAAPALAELLNLLSQTFAEHDPAWRRGQLTAPPIVAAETFAAFRRTVQTTGDLLFQNILTSVDAFLPALLYPKTYATDASERLLGRPLSTIDWQDLVRNVVGWCLSTNWGRRREGVCHA